jgi:hypothetical protein
MIICSETCNISLRSWKTEEEMTDFLSECNKGTLLLGRDAEYITDFHSVRIDYNGSDSFGIGIYSEGHGLEPHLLVKSDKLIIGFDTQVTGIDIIRRKPDFQIRLNSLFRSFILLKQHRIILILHETGVVAVTEKGQELWSFDEDIIEDYSIDKQSLFLEFSDTESVRLNIISGELIPQTDDTEMEYV